MGVVRVSGLISQVCLPWSCCAWLVYVIAADLSAEDTQNMGDDADLQEEEQALRSEKEAIMQLRMAQVHAQQAPPTRTGAPGEVINAAPLQSIGSSISTTSNSSSSSVSSNSSSANSSAVSNATAQVLALTPQQLVERALAMGISQKTLADDAISTEEKQALRPIVLLAQAKEQLEKKVQQYGEHRVKVQVRARYRRMVRTETERSSSFQRAVSDAQQRYVSAVQDYFNEKKALQKMRDMDVWLGQRVQEEFQKGQGVAANQHKQERETNRVKMPEQVDIIAAKKNLARLARQKLKEAKQALSAETERQRKAREVLSRYLSQSKDALRQAMDRSLARSAEVQGRLTGDINHRLLQRAVLARVRSESKSADGERRYKARVLYHRGLVDEIPAELQERDPDWELLMGTFDTPMLSDF